MHKPIKIVIIDNHPMVIKGISMFLYKLYKLVFTVK